MNLILSSRNQGKIEQIKPVFAGLPLTVLSLSDAGIEGEAVEDGTTLEQNAKLKATYAWQARKWSMADDTGIFIDALGGQPGVYSARWAGKDKTTAEITAHTLEKLRHVLPNDRGATFRTVAVLIDPDGHVRQFSGEVRGTILPSQRCEPQKGMPYSGIFVPEGTGKVWAEMTVEEENKISHRGKAFAKVRRFFEEYFEQIKTPA